VAQIGKDLVTHTRSYASGIDEFAVVAVVAEQQRTEMRSRSFRVRPTDDDELLSVECFSFAPEAAISRRIATSIVFETTPSKPSLPACFRMSSPSPASSPLN
jgi:hypothetical protein